MQQRRAVGAATSPSPPPGEALRVETGALDDGRHYGRQLTLAIVGWVLVVALITLLVIDVGEIAVRVTLFLVAVIVSVALISTTVAVEVLRPPLIRARRSELEPIRGDNTIDALGRPVESTGARLLTGEIEIGEEQGVRRYTSAGGTR